MQANDVLAILAAQLPDLVASNPDLARLRVIALYAQVCLDAIELSDLEARIARLENPEPAAD